MTIWLIAAVAPAIAAIFWATTRKRAERRGSTGPYTFKPLTSAEQEKMRLSAHAATRTAKDFQIDLDFAPASIRNIDGILALLRTQWPDFTPTKREHELMQWGSYVGEVFARERSGEWVRDPQVSGLTGLAVRSGRTAIYPLRWIAESIADDAQAVEAKYRFFAVGPPPILRSDRAVIATFSMEDEEFSNAAGSMASRLKKAGIEPVTTVSVSERTCRVEVLPEDVERARQLLQSSSEENDA